MIAGINDITIGDTICNETHPVQLPSIKIEEPTMSMNFIVNTSPFAGRKGKFVTTRYNIYTHLDT